MDAEDGVEGVRLSTGLRSLSVRRGFRLGASVLSSLVCATAVDELVAHELGDNVTVLGRAMGVGHYD